MYKYRRIFICAVAGVLALALVLSIVIPALAASSKEIKEKIEGLKEQEAAVEAKQRELDVEIAGKQSELLDQVERKNQIDQKISLTQQAIEIKTQEIADAEQDEADEYELFRKRVRAMEETKTTSYLGVLLGAGSFSELLSRLEVINDIMTYDRDVMANLKEARERKETAKQELENDRAESAQIKWELEQQQKEAEEKSAEVEALLEQLNSDYQYTASEIARIQEDIDAAQKEIARIEEEQRKAEEARRKAEEEKRRAAEQAKYVGGKFLWPLPSPYYSNYITQGFVYRVHQFTGKYGLHGGIDIGCPSGTSIYAANSGTVVTSTRVKSYGNYVMIDHGGGVYTLYAHMSQRLVSEGDKVTRGQVIGKVGMTGYATGPHLHFEIRKNGNYVNPMNEF